MLRLTLTLAVISPHGWRHLRAACEREQALPRPLMWGAAISWTAVLSAFIHASRSPDATVGQTTLSLLYAATAYLGAATIAALLIPRLVQRWVPNEARPWLQHFAVASALPLLISGVFASQLAHPTAAWLTVGALCLTCASSYWGARLLLGQSGIARLMTAVTTAAIAGVLPLGIAMACST